MHLSYREQGPTLALPEPTLALSEMIACKVGNVRKQTLCLSKAKRDWSLPWHSSQEAGPSPIQGFSLDGTPPPHSTSLHPSYLSCAPGEDGLTLDVTGTQLLEKDIENLARGEVPPVK